MAWLSLGAAHGLGFLRLKDLPCQAYNNKHLVERSRSCSLEETLLTVGWKCVSVVSCLKVCCFLPSSIRPSQTSSLPRLFWGELDNVVKHCTTFSPMKDAHCAQTLEAASAGLLCSSPSPAELDEFVSIWDVRQPSQPSSRWLPANMNGIK